MALFKPKPGQQFGKKDLSWCDPDFLASYPTLMSYLKDTSYDDARPRVTSTLLLFVEAGCLKICLNDRDNLRSAFFNYDTIESTFAGIEAALAADDVDWKSKGSGTGNGAKIPY